MNFSVWCFIVTNTCATSIVEIDPVPAIVESEAQAMAIEHIMKHGCFIKLHMDDKKPTHVRPIFAYPYKVIRSSVVETSVRIPDIRKQIKN